MSILQTCINIEHLDGIHRLTNSCTYAHTVNMQKNGTDVFNKVLGVLNMVGVMAYQWSDDTGQLLSHFICNCTFS